eukprot:3349476-Prymnesium_polylepis.1
MRVPQKRAFSLRSRSRCGVAEMRWGAGRHTPGAAHTSPKRPENRSWHRTIPIVHTVPAPHNTDWRPRAHGHMQEMCSETCA